jgi:hypothetical protein
MPKGSLMIDEKEWQTRKERIDKKLKAFNPSWQIIKYSDERKDWGLEILVLFLAEAICLASSHQVKRYDG